MKRERKQDQRTQDDEVVLTAVPVRCQGGGTTGVRAGRRFSALTQGDTVIGHLDGEQTGTGMGSSGGSLSQLICSLRAVADRMLFSDFRWVFGFDKSSIATVMDSTKEYPGFVLLRGIAAF